MDANEIPYDTREDLPGRNSGFAWCDPLDEVVAVLATGDYHLEGDDREFINFLSEWGKKKGYLEWWEARRLGAMWKRHYNNGVYIHHDWWDGTDKKLTPENVNALRLRFHRLLQERK
jgi:hypothetical protein